AQEMELQDLRQQLEEANKNLMRLSAFDSLTEVTNRRRFEDFLDQEWRRAAQQSKPLALILLDLDFFKAYNDTYGNEAGDAYLKRVADILTGVLRSDKPDRIGDVVGRWGGDEFAVLLRETPVANAKVVADRIQEALSAVENPKPGMRVLTASVGLAGFPDHGQTKRHLLHRAEQAMFRAKDLGRNRICSANDT
ncbi:MAG: GGDEF domain-containing protein, partial [Nitrospirales bacterium]